ncbi:MAG: glycosyltransferase family 4 protein [Desulfamplus sp.]|nr:glycosyltransferase family 4 protein [Desulfamplus sp.]
MANVCIIQRRLTHYRVPFFNALRKTLERCGISLKLLVGGGTPAEREKRDASELPWAHTIPTIYLAGGRLCWQSIRHYIADSDLVIVTQENSLLYNHLLIIAPRRFKLAFWGHGANFQSCTPNGLKERFKRWEINRVDWWFAYTQLSADVVAAAGFPVERITVVNNAIDISALQRQRLVVTPEETRALRESLGFSTGPVAVFVGSLYQAKRLEFLFSAAEKIRRRVQDFQLLLLGDGPDRDEVRKWCTKNLWARWAGTQFGKQKAGYLSLAQVMLNPGLVGLNILDSFACGLPLITTACGIHSPEIAYLENGVNGVMVLDDLNEYVEATVRLMQDTDDLELLRDGCFTSAKVYTMDNFCRRFAEGIVGALNV